MGAVLSMQSINPLFLKHDRHQRELQRSNRTDDIVGFNKLRVDTHRPEDSFVRINRIVGINRDGLARAHLLYGITECYVSL